MENRKTLTILLVSLMLTLSFVSNSNATAGTATLYAHSEAIKPGATSYKILKTTAPDGPESKLSIATAAADEVALGNSSVMLVGSLETYVWQLTAATWTVNYYAVANVTQKTTLLCNVTLLDSTGATKSQLAGFDAETNLLTATNTTYTGTVSIAEVDVNATDYLRIIWFANKTDVTQLNVTLWLDVSATTKITGVAFDYPSSAYWNDSLRTTWKVLLPIIFVITVALRFIVGKDKPATMGEIIVWCVAFVFLAIAVPIGLDIIATT